MAGRRDVCLNRKTLPALGFDLSADLIQPIFASCCNYQLRAVPSELDRRRPADAGRTAGDNNDLIFECPRHLVDKATPRPRHFGGAAASRFKPAVRKPEWTCENASEQERWAPWLPSSLLSPPSAA